MLSEALLGEGQRLARPHFSARGEGVAHRVKSQWIRCRVIERRGDDAVQVLAQLALRSGRQAKEEAVAVRSLELPDIVLDILDDDVAAIGLALFLALRLVE